MEVLKRTLFAVKITSHQVKIQIMKTMSVHLCMCSGYTAERFRLVVCPVTVFNILGGVVPVTMRQHHYIVCLS